MIKFELIKRWLLGFALAVSLPVGSQANIFNANSAATLVTALNSANTTVGSHTIQLAAGTYTLTAELPVIASGKNIVFQGGTANPADTVLHQTAAARILETFFDGSANNVVLTFNNLTFENGQSGTFGGGAILVGGIGSSTTVNNCVFHNNTTTLTGTGLAGGALENSPDGFVTVLGCRFTGNAASLAGGAISFLHQADSGSAGGLVVSNSVFINNSCVSEGGAITANTASGNLTIVDCNFENNHVTKPDPNGGRGGAISHVSGPLVAQHNRFFGNTAATHSNGDTIFQASGTGTIDATRNWWGANTGPGPADFLLGATFVTSLGHLQLSHVPGVAALGVGGGTLLTADLRTLSTGGTVAASDLAGLPALPDTAVTLFNNTTPSLGSLSGANTRFSQGVATATFTAGSAKGVAAINATLDNQTVTANITLPTAVVSINRVTASPANLGTVQWTVTFDSAVNGVGSGNFTLANTGLGGTPAITTVSPAGAAPTTTWTVTASTGSGSGTIGLNMTGATGVSSPINNLTFVGQVYIVDLAPPTTTLTATPPASSSSSAASFSFTGADVGSGLAGFEFSLDGSGFASATSPKSFTGLADGSHTFQVRAKDNAGNVDATPDSFTWTIDASPPTIAIGSPSVSPAKSGPVTYTVTYTDAHFTSSTLVPGNVTLNKTGTANATSITVSGSGSTRTVTLSGITGDGTLGISLVAGTASDAAGNLAGPAGPSAVFTVDNTPPAVAISNPSSAATAGGPVSFTVTYTDANFASSTLASGNITLNKTGTANASSIGVSGSGNTRTVTLSAITGDGTLGISVAAGTASDAAGNLAGPAGPSPSFTVDNTPPVVFISAPSLALVSSLSGPVTFTVTYLDDRFDASTLALADITLNKTGTANGTLSVNGTGNTRTVTIDQITGDGTLGITLRAGTARDLAGNLAPAVGPSGSLQVIVIDRRQIVRVLDAVTSLSRRFALFFSHFAPS